MAVPRCTDTVAQSPRCRSCLEHAVWLSSGAGTKSRLSECGIWRPRTQFPRAGGAQSRAHTSPPPCSLSPAFGTAGASLKAVACRPTLFQRFTFYQQEVSSLRVDWLLPSSVSCRLTKRCSYFKYGAMTSIAIIIACIKALEIRHGSCI